MTRIVEGQLLLNSLFQIFNTKGALDKYSQQLSSGLKVSLPSDDYGNAGTVSQFSNANSRLNEHLDRLEMVRGHLAFQDGVISQTSDLMIRAKEIATQAANGTIGSEVRSQMAAEVFQLRDAIVGLANSQYQGRYIYAGAEDNNPPYSPATPPGYPTPGTGPEGERYVFTTAAGASTTRNVQITDDFNIRLNSTGNAIFDNAIHALERLGRALAGYQTLPATGAPTGAGGAYTFPADYDLQTADIQATISLIDDARRIDISNERTNLAGRLTRLDTAHSILDGLKTSVTENLAQLQAADTAEAATLLTEAQTRYQASLAATSRMLDLSNILLNYL